ncbi:phage adaptor protein, partial [Streptococcus pyogenes]
SRDLIDASNVRWSRPELIDFLNDAIAAIVLRRPDLTRKTVTIDVDSFTVGLPVDLYKVLAVNHINLMAAQYVDINKLNQLYPN